MYNHNVLSELYKLLHKEALTNPDKCPAYKKLIKILPPHWVVYARAAIEANLGLKLDYALTEKSLRKEGYVPSYEHKIPQWYVDKWLTKNSGSKVPSPKAMSDDTISNSKS